MKDFIVNILLKLLDIVLNVQKDKPVYIVFCGEGCVEFQEYGEETVKLKV